MAQPEAAYLLLPEHDYTFGPAVADLCAAADFAPDPLQESILGSVFGERHGLPAMQEGMLIGPRQNYKSGALEQIFLGWMFVTWQPGAIWTAQRHDTARGSFDHLVQLIADHAFLSKHLAGDPITSKGAEEIRLKGGRVFRFYTRTGPGVRGRSYGKHIYDEYLYMTAEQLAAVAPTQSTFPDFQSVGATSAGLPSSAEARKVRDRGRAMDPVAEPHLLYVECCDDLPGGCARGEECSHLPGTPGCRMDDEARVARANPQAGGRIGWPYLRGERRKMTPATYGRERLGYWDEPAEDAKDTLDAVAWQRLLDEESVPGSPVVFGLDVAPSRGWATIAAAARTDAGRVHVEITGLAREGFVELDHRTGTSWILGRFKQLRVEFPGARVRLQGRSQAESFRTKLEQMGFSVEVVDYADWPACCAQMLDMLTELRLVHTGQLELDASVESVVVVPVGEEAFRWGRRKSSGDIGPWMAATLAATGLLVEPVGFNIW